MPVIPEYKPENTTVKPLSIPENKTDFTGTGLASSLSGVINEAAKTVGSIVDENHEVLARQGLARIQTEAMSFSESMRSASDAERLRDSYIDDSINAFTEARQEIMESYESPAVRRMIQNAIDGNDIEGRLRLAGIGYQREARRNVDEATFKANDSRLSGNLAGEAMAGDVVGMADSVYALAKIRLQKVKERGVDDETAKGMVAQSIDQTVIMTWDTIKNGSLQQKSLFYKTVKPYLTPATAQLLEKNLDGERQALNAHGKIDRMFSGGRPTVTPDVSIHLSNGNMAITKNGETATLPIQNENITPETLPQTIDMINRQNGIGTKIPNISRQHLPILNQIIPLAEQLEQDTGVPADVLIALAIAESGLNPNSVSKAGARGIAQFMPGTARAYGVDTSNVESSMRGMAKYLKKLKETDGFTWDEAVGAYNMGEGTRGGDKGMHGVLAGKARLPQETENHITKIAMLRPFIRRMLGRPTEETQNRPVDPGVSLLALDEVTLSQRTAEALGISDRFTNGQPNEKADANDIALFENAKKQATARQEALRTQLNEIDAQLPDIVGGKALDDETVATIMASPAVSGLPHEVRRLIRNRLSLQNQTALEQKWRANNHDLSVMSSDAAKTMLKRHEKQLAIDGIGIIPISRFRQVTGLAGGLDLKNMARVQANAQQAKAGILPEIAEKTLSANRHLLTGIPKDGSSDRDKFNQVLGRYIAQNYLSTGREVTPAQVIEAVNWLTAQSSHKDGWIFDGSGPNWEALYQPEDGMQTDSYHLFIPYGSNLDNLHRYLASVGIQHTPSLVNYLYTRQLAMLGAPLPPETIDMMTKIEDGKVKVSGLSDINEVWKRYEEGLTAAMLVPAAPPGQWRAPSSSLDAAEVSIFGGFTTGNN